jgi:hypothetical protein
MPDIASRYHVGILEGLMYLIEANNKASRSDNLKQETKQLFRIRT